MINRVKKVNTTIAYIKGSDRFLVHLPKNTPPVVPDIGANILATEIDESGAEHIRMDGVVKHVVQSHSHSMPTDTFAYIIEVVIQ